MQMFKPFLQFQHSLCYLLQCEVISNRKTNSTKRQQQQQQLSHLSQVFGGRLHEPKENYASSSTWISFLHSFLSINMPSLRPLASISCRIASIHVLFGLLCAFLTCPKLICSTRQTGASVSVRRTWPNYHRQFSLIFSSIVATPILVRIS